MTQNLRFLITGFMKVEEVAGASQICQKLDFLINLVVGSFPFFVKLIRRF
jgi:hypothetical protein